MPILDTDFPASRKIASVESEGFASNSWTLHVSES